MRFEFRHDGLYLIYTKSIWNRIECQYLKITIY